MNSCFYLAIARLPSITELIGVGLIVAAVAIHREQDAAAEGATNPQ